MNALPDKPSELIRLAISDFQKAKNDSNVDICMGTWYEQCDRCLVCLAGSVMKYTLKLNRIGPYGPSFFDSDTGKKLQALNNFRIGFVQEGCDKLNRETKIYSYHIPYPYTDYRHDSFCQDMLELAALLEAEGN